MKTLLILTILTTLLTADCFLEKKKDSTNILLKCVEIQEKVVIGVGKNHKIDYKKLSNCEKTHKKNYKMIADCYLSSYKNQ